jgi:hypothetical protein
MIGLFPSLKMGRMVAFESLIEQDYLYVLDYEAAVTAFEEQPLTYQARDLLGISNRRLMGYIRRGNLVPIAGPDLDGCYIYLFPLRKVERLARHLQKLQQKRISAAVPN